MSHLKQRRRNGSWTLSSFRLITFRQPDILADAEQLALATGTAAYSLGRTNQTPVPPCSLVQDVMETAPKIFGPR